MPREDDLKDELLVHLCCGGDRCMSGVGDDDREGGCERWIHSNDADATLARLANETASKLAAISKRSIPGR